MACFFGIANCASAQDFESNPLRQFYDTAGTGDARPSIAESHAPVIRRAEEVAVRSQPAVTPRAVLPKELPAAEVEPEATSEKEMPAGIASAEDVRAMIETVKGSEGGDEEKQAALLALLEKSLASIQYTEEAKQQTTSYLAEVALVPVRIEELTAQLRLPNKAAIVPAAQHATLEAISTGAASATAAVAKARQSMKEHQARDSELSDVRKGYQKRLEELSSKLAEVKQQLESEGSAPKGMSEIYLQAWRTELQTRREKLTVKIDFLNAEASLAKAMIDVYPLQSDFDRREVARLEEEEKRWQSSLSRKRDLESERQIREAERQAAEADPALRKLAAENANLATLRSNYAKEINKVSLELQDIRGKFDSQEEQFRKIKEKVDDMGMTETIGHLLRSHDRDLLSSRPLRIRAKEIEEENLPQIELLLIQLTEQRDAMWDMDGLAQEHVDVDALLSRHTAAAAQQMVQDVLTTRRKYLDDLSTDLHIHQQNLTDLHDQLKKTAKVTADHHRYIGERVLWIRSADMVSLADVDASRKGVAELLDPSLWMQVVRDVGVHLQANLFVWLVLLVAFTVGLIASDRIKDRISAIGASNPVKSAYRFGPTFEVTLETMCLAAFFPGMMFGLSLYLTRFPAASSLEIAIGVGLRYTSMMWLALSILQQVVRPDGLAEVHFGWHIQNVRVIRKNLGLLIVFGLPALFAVMVIGAFRDGEYVSSLGRLSFMAGMSVMALFTHRLLNPYRTKSGIWANREVLLFRVRHIVHGLGIAVPVALTVFSALGYVYSANQLAFRAQLTLWLLLGIVICQALIARYLTIARRNAAVRHMQRRRAELAENADSEIPIEEEIDFASIDGQVRRLLRGGTIALLVVGASLIWADMVPALMILNEIPLWHVQTVQIEGPPVTTWITLADLLLAVSAILATVMAARNLPGLLNITIFERLPIDYGTRYALTAVSRYAISLIGIVLAFQCLGVTWRSVQWLVAAMTVGLGFGLQEIFANFVSGLIIFTERPVRVGDIVTVGGITGKVTRVQIRATTITDFDRRELVVPNKRFITEDVVNWTLSDPISRVVLPVGIGYDCDPEQACEQLLDVGAKHPLVLKEPEATAVFVGFGDSTLDLELRVFVMGRDYVASVRDQLNLSIKRAFDHANIEISYPQRDLHIRSVDAAALAETIRPRRAA